MAVSCKINQCRLQCTDILPSVNRGSHISLLWTIHLSFSRFHYDEFRAQHTDHVRPWLQLAVPTIFPCVLTEIEELAREFSKRQFDTSNDFEESHLGKASLPLAHVLCYTGGFQEELPVSGVGQKLWTDVSFGETSSSWTRVAHLVKQIDKNIFPADLMEEFNDQVLIRKWTSYCLSCDILFHCSRLWATEH